VEEFFKSCFDNGAVALKEIGGWKAGWEESVPRVAQASHAEIGYRLVSSSCYCKAA